MVRRAAGIGSARHAGICGTATGCRRAHSSGRPRPDDGDVHAAGIPHAGATRLPTEQPLLRRHAFRVSLPGAHSTGGRPIYHRYDEASAEERRFLDEYRDDVKQYQPRLIVINDTSRLVRVAQGFQHVRVSRLLRLGRAIVEGLSGSSRLQRGGRCSSGSRRRADVSRPDRADRTGSDRLNRERDFRRYCRIAFGIYHLLPTNPTSQHHAQQRSKFKFIGTNTPFPAKNGRNSTDNPAAWCGSPA